MAPPKWTVFDGIDDAEEEDGNTGETNGAAGNTDGEEDTYGVPEASASGDVEPADSAGESEDGAADKKEEDEDPKEGDGDKPDKKELLICAGAMCTCTQAVSPTPVALKVQMQDKYSINDPDGTTKYLATDKEVDKSALDFVQCKFPDPSKPKPCTTQLVWKDFYEHMVLPGGAHPLTFKSTAICTVGTGEVAFQTTGQQSTVTPEQVEAANSAGWPQENPILDENPADVELEKDDAEGDQKGIGVLAIKAKTAGPYPVGTTITFEATRLSPTKKTYTAAELQGINWNVYDASLKPCGQAIDGGRETDIKFNKAGRFTVEGYGVTAGGNSKEAKTQKQSAVATLTIEENKLAGVQRKGGSGGTEYRFEETAVYELTTLFPVAQTPLPRRQTLENVVWTVLKKDGMGEPVLVAAGSSATVTCTAPCDYIVIATLGETTQQSVRMKAIKNGVAAVTASLKTCRPGEEVVLKAKFKIEPALPAELALLKWACKDGKGVESKDVLVPGSQEQRLRLKPVGHYKVWAFVNSPSKTVVAEFEVMQPKIKLVQWVYPDKETGKKVTGWEEENTVKMVFESAQGLGAEATVGVVRDNAFHPVMKPFSFTVGTDNEDSFHFVLTKEGFKGKVKEGDYLSVRINCTTPDQSIAGGATHMLQFTEKEGLGGIAFYKGKEKVNQAHYGDTLRCRVYGRNLSAGKARVIIGRFESLGGKGPQVPVIVENQTVIIGESGYGEFDFFLNVSKAKGTKSTIHKFGAWIQEAEVGGKHIFVKPEEAKGIQMLFVQVPVGVGSGAPSEAGIEKGENAPVDGKCVCKDYDLIWGGK